VWQCVLWSAGVCVALCLIFFDYAVIYCACICGSYMLFRGLSIFIGGFPNEFLVYESLVNEKFGQQATSLFVYLLLIILCSVFAV